MSRLADVYNNVYAALAGKGVELRPWHFQWLSARCLHRQIKLAVSQFNGRVLDVGCGDKPFAPFMDHKRVTELIGLDIFPGTNVDIVLAPEEPWPIGDETFDGVLCTEVLEHVTDLGIVVREIQRVLKPGGLLIVSVPFCYPFHGYADGAGDYRRLTAAGLERSFREAFTTQSVTRCGGAGSVGAYGLLVAFDLLLNRTFAMRVIKGLLLPVYMAACFLMNMVGRLLDSLDFRQILYTHVVYIGKKVL